MNKLFWILLQKIFCPGVDDDLAQDDDSEQQDDTASEDNEAEDEMHEEEESEQEEEAPKVESRAQKEIRTLRDRAQKAEDDAKQAREQIAAASRSQQQPNAQQIESQKLWEEEEAALKNPNIDEWQRYGIHANRNARAAAINSERALQEARDLRDQTDFDRIAISNPKAAERYRDKVEEMKKQNPNAPRAKLLALCLGEDMLNGKFKSETKSTTKSGGANRGKLPGARSDTKSSGSEKGNSIEAIEKRLSGIRI